MGAPVLPRHMSEEKACYTERAGTGQPGTGLSADPVNTRGSSGLAQRGTYFKAI